MKTILIFLLLFATVNLTLAQGKLEKAKDDLSDKSTSDKSDVYSSDDDGDSDDVANALIGGLMVDILYYSSVWLLIGEVQPRSFYQYPYSAGRNGEYDSPPVLPYTKRSLLVLSNTIVFQPDVIGNDLKAGIRFIPELGLDANHLHFVDIIGEKSEQGFTSFMLNYYRIRERSVTAFWGIGTTYAGSGVDTWGFAYQVAMDIFVVKPVSLSLGWKQSFINEGTVNEIQTMVKYHYMRLEIRGGFNHYKIGDENFPCAAFGIGYRF